MKISEERTTFLKKIEKDEKDFLEKYRRMCTSFNPTILKKAEKSLSADKLESEYELLDIESIKEYVVGLEADICEDPTIPHPEIKKQVHDDKKKIKLAKAIKLAKLILHRELHYMLKPAYIKLPNEIKSVLDQPYPAIEENISLLYSFRNENLIYHVKYIQDVFSLISKVLKGGEK